MLGYIFAFFLFLLIVAVCMPQPRTYHAKPPKPVPYKGPTRSEMLSMEIENRRKLREWDAKHGRK